MDNKDNAPTYREWDHDDIFTWKSGQQINIFLHHSYTTQGYGCAKYYMDACLDLLSSVALLQMTVFSPNKENIKIFDHSSELFWDQEWPEFPEDDYQSCNLLLGTLHTESGMKPGNGRVFGTSGESDKYSMFCRLFHEHDLGTLLLLKSHEKLWCRIPSYRKITKTLGYGIWKSIKYHYFDGKDEDRLAYYNFPDFRKHHKAFEYRRLGCPIWNEELCLMGTYNNVLENTYNIRKLIYESIS